MRWRTFARTEIRRRAIVGGRALEADGRPFVDAACLSLCTVDTPASASASAPKPAPAASGRKRRSAKAGSAVDEARAATAVPAPWTRCYPCHIRPDGRFFFLDVPAGRYVLERVDSDGNVVQSEEVSIPAVGPDARLPVASIEFDIVRPAARPRTP